MAERYPDHRKEGVPEQSEQGHDAKVERHITEAEKLKHRQEQAESLQGARQEATIEAKSIDDTAQELAAKHHEHQPPQEQLQVNRELKEMAYQRLLIRARRQLSPYSRMMSRLIHQPLVDSISETASKTIARPSGILGGGILAVIGTSTYYYIARHYGYSYNSFIFLLLLAAGFVIGWLVEFFYRLAKTLKR